MSTSNASTVFANIERWLDGFNFARPGREQSLGRDTAMVIIRGPDVGAQGGIMGRCAAEVTPDGVPWPPNSDDPAGHGYASRKEELYGWRETNRRTSQMLSQQSLYGKTTIEPFRVTLRYGEDTPPSNSKSPTGYISDQDKSVTDVQKATWAHEQGRGFYAATGEDRHNVVGMLQKDLDGYVRERNES